MTGRRNFLRLSLCGAVVVAVEGIALLEPEMKTGIRDKRGQWLATGEVRNGRFECMSADGTGIAAEFVVDGKRYPLPNLGTNCITTGDIVWIDLSVG